MSLSLLLTSIMICAKPAWSAPFRYAEDRAPAIVNPLFTTMMSEARLNELLFEGLYTDDEELTTAPLLAESAEVSADRKSMVITLRKGVTWHDGHPFDAEDVVFTINTLKDRRTLSTEAGRVAWIKDVDMLDSHTVRLRFERAEAAPQDKLFFKVLPSHSFDTTTVKRTDAFRNNPIGTGPYQLVSYNDDNSITMRQATKASNPATLSEMVLREVSDKNYQAKLLLYESLEALVRVLPRDLAVLQNNRKVELYPYQTNSWWYLGFNMNSRALGNKAVRQAFCQLVDVAGLLAPVGTGDVLSGPFVKSSPYYNHDVAPWEHQPEAAATLLKSAGYTRTSEGWSKAGRPLRFKITAHKSLESSQEVVINLQSQLQNQGIKVDVEFLDDATWKARIWREQDYEIILSQWSFDRNEDVREQLHSAGSRNFMAYRNNQVDRLLDAAQTTTDPQEKKTSLRALHQVVRDDAPMLFLWTLDSYSAMNVKVENVVIHPFYFFTWMRHWQMR